jgi:hypothetical protein
MATEYRRIMRYGPGSSSAETPEQEDTPEPKGGGEVRLPLYSGPHAKRTK